MTTWLKSISEELRQAIEPVEIPKEIKPQKDYFLVPIANELRQLVNSINKMPKLKKTESQKKPVSEFSEMANFFRSWLAERQAELEKWDEIVISPPPNYVAPGWFLSQVAEIRSLVNSFDQEVEISKSEQYRYFWFEEIVDQIWDILLAPEPVKKASKPEVFKSEWLTEICKDLKKALDKFSQEDTVQVAQPQPFHSRWLDKSVDELRPLLKKLRKEAQMPIIEPKEETGYYDLPGWLRVEIEGLRRSLAKIQRSETQNRPIKSFDNKLTGNWLSGYARNLKRFLPQQVSLVKPREVSFDRDYPEIPAEFQKSPEGKKGDEVVSKLTLDRKRFKEYESRLSHPEPTRVVKARDKKRANRKGQMAVIGVATNKVDRTGKNGYREVFIEIEDPRCHGLIDLRETRVARWRKFDPATVKVVVVSSERSSGHDGWKAQQESYLSSVDARHSGGYGAKTATIPEGDENAERCIPVLANDGRTTVCISFGEYLSLEGKTINGVCAELRKKYEI